MIKRDMTKEEELGHFFGLLVDEKIAFTELMSLYVRYLEKKDKEQWRDIVEGSTLVLAQYNPKIWAGTKKSLKERIVTFLNKHKLFNEIK